MTGRSLKSLLGRRGLDASVTRGIAAVLLAALGALGAHAQDLAPAGQEDPAPARLTFLTYNVLADPVQTEKRALALLKIIREADADVVALQEVAPWLLKRWLADDALRKRYRLAKSDGAVATPGGQFIASRYPIESSQWKVLPGKQRRTALVSRLKVAGRTMDVATMHMESYLEDGPVRAQQLDAIFPLVKDADDAVVLGDFNFGDGETESDRLDKAYTDLWRAVKAGDPGFTWNVEKSPMAKEGSFPGEPSRRIDRILVRSAMWRPKEARIVGDEAIEGTDGRLVPSDHFGLMGVVEAGTAGREKQGGR